MSIEAIRDRAATFEQRHRRWRLMTATSVALALAVQFGQMFQRPGLLERVGDLLITAALLYVVYATRDYWRVESMPNGLGLTASADFYREQLARRREQSARPWRYLVLLVPGFVLTAFGDALERSTGQNIAVAVAGIAVFVGAAWLNQHKARELQKEIDDLEP